LASKTPQTLAWDDGNRVTRGSCLRGRKGGKNGQERTTIWGKRQSTGDPAGWGGGITMKKNRVTIKRQNTNV